MIYYVSFATLCEKLMCSVVKGQLIGGTSHPLCLLLGFSGAGVEGVEEACYFNNV